MGLGTPGSSGRGCNARDGGGSGGGRTGGGSGGRPVGVSQRSSFSAEYGTSLGRRFRISQVKDEAYGWWRN